MNKSNINKISKSKVTFRVMVAGILVAAVMCAPVMGANFTASALEGSNVLKLTEIEGHQLLSKTLSIDSYTDSEQQALERASAVDKAKVEAEQSVQEVKDKKEAEELASKEAENQQESLEASESTEVSTEAEEVINSVESTESTESAEAEMDVESAQTPDDSSASQTVVGDATSTGYLLSIDNPDPNYVSRSVSLSADDRYILERLVMGESGNQGFIGAALVAQTIRDTMIYDGYSSVEQVRTACGYYGSLSIEPNQDVLDAVSYIFDQGGAAVQHQLRYFYAYKICSSPWHESQNHIVTYLDVKFFDRW